MITWDENKRRQVIKDHGVDFARIKDVFEDHFAIYEADRERDSEVRWLVIAKSAEYGLIAVIYTFRGDDIRMITARRAEKWMVRIYEKQRNRF